MLGVRPIMAIAILHESICGGAGLNHAVAGDAYRGPASGGASQPRKTPRGCALRGSRYGPRASGFFVQPDDTNSNNLRVFVT